MLRTGAPTFLLVLISGLLIVRESSHPPVSLLEEGFATWLSRNGVPTTAPPDAAVTLVTITPGESSDLSPLDISLAASSAQSFRPAVTAIDHSLNWTAAPLAPADEADLPQARKILENVLLQVPKLVLTGTLGQNRPEQTATEAPALPVLRNVEGDVAQIPEQAAIENLPEEAFRPIGNLGFIADPAAENTPRSVPLLLRYRGELVPTLALEAVRLWAKKTPAEVRVRIGRDISLGPDFRIPIDAAGQMRVNYRASWSIISAGDLILGARELELGKKTTADTSHLAGSILLLTQAQTEPQGEELPAPAPAPTSGAEGQLSHSAIGAIASAIATMQSRTFWQHTPAWVSWALIALASAAALALPRWSKSAVLTGVFISWITYGLLAMALNTFAHYCLPLTLPLGMGAVLVFLRLVAPKTWKPTPGAEAGVDDARPA